MGQARGQRTLPQPVVRVESGRKVLRVGGVIQSVTVAPAVEPDIWDALVPATCPANVLILGLGGGTVATLITERWGAVPIIGVEQDPAVAWLAQHEFGLATLPHVQVIVGDAFEYVRTCQTRFDAICVDLYVAGKLAHGVLGTAFLRDVTRLLRPGGSATFNLWRSPYLDDHLRRLTRHLHITSSVLVDDNLIVVATPRSTLTA